MSNRFKKHGQRLTLLVTILLLAHLPNACTGNDHVAEYLQSEDIAPTVIGIQTFLATLESTPEQSSQIAAHIEQLKSNQFSKRRSAFKKLSQYGKAATVHLRQATESDDAEVRRAAKRLLAVSLERDYDSLLHACYQQLTKLNAPSTVPLIISSVRLTNRRIVQEQAAKAVGQLATRNQRQLLQRQLHADDDRLVRLALHGLARIDDDDDWDSIRSFLSSKNDKLRLTAARLCFQRHPRKSIATLLELMASDKVETRHLAAQSLRDATQRRHGFIAYDKLKNRDDALKLWKNWFSEQRDLRFPKTKTSPQKFARSLLLSGPSGIRLINLKAKELWEHECSVYDAQMLGDGRAIVADRNGGTITVIDRAGKTLRTITGLQAPSDVEYLPNDHILVLQNGANVVSEFNSDNNEIWSASGLNNAFDVDRLPNGNTLVADSGNGRIVEFNRKSEIAWELREQGFVNNVCRLADGNTAFTTYTDGGIAIANANKQIVRSTTLDKQPTLYAVQVDGENLVVADGANQRLIWLNLLLKPVRELQVPNDFVDVSYVR